MRVYSTEQGPHESIVHVVDGHTGAKIGVLNRTAFGWDATHLRQTRSGERKRMRLDFNTGTPLYTDREAAISWIRAQEDNYRG